METFSFAQHQVVHNLTSFTLAAMLAAFVFFILARSEVSEKYRSALIMSAIVVGIADVLAKAGYGLMIYWIARVKTEADQQEEASEFAAVPASAD